MRAMQRPNRAKAMAGFAVHAFTASGAAVAVLALNAAYKGEFPACFAWLGVALFIDGVDGSLARAARVRETAPIIDGATLDLVVDYLTYVLAPLVALARSDLLPDGMGLYLTSAVAVASALYFSDTRMKTRDHWFRGFPALWNVAALYIFVLRLPPYANAVILSFCAVMMFAPFVFVHPMRVVRFRMLTLVMTMAWFALAGYAINANFNPEAWVRIGFVLVAAYFLALPFTRKTPWAED
jgi:phosphatidylcholine synthase